jgi:tape measure domain-containing protein
VTVNVLRFDFLARNQFSPTADKVGKEVDGLGSRVSRFGKFAGTALVGVGVAMSGMAVAGVSLGVKTAASLEQAQIGFASLLHSGTQAQVFLKGLTAFAAATPFTLNGLIDSSRTLIGVGVSAKSTMQILQNFGDASSAVGLSQDSFQRIMVATSQAIGAGRFQTADLNQIMNNGLPIWHILAEATGKTTIQLRDMASKGKLLAADVLPELQMQMHKDYGGAMMKQSETLNGLWSTFTDTLSLGLAKAITPMIPALKVGLAGASTVAAAALVKLPVILHVMTSAFVAGRNYVMTQFVPTFRKAFTDIGKLVPHINLSGIGREISSEADVWGQTIIHGITIGLRTGDWGSLGASLSAGFSLAFHGALKGGINLTTWIGQSISSINWQNTGIASAFLTESQTWAETIIHGITIGLQSGDWNPLGLSLGTGLSLALSSALSGGANLAGALVKLFGQINWYSVGEIVGKGAFSFVIGLNKTLIEGIFTGFKQHPLDALLLVAAFIPLGKFAAAFGPLRDLIEHLPFGSWITGALDHSAVPAYDAVVRFGKWALDGVAAGIKVGFREVIPESDSAVLSFVRGMGTRLLNGREYLAQKAAGFVNGITVGIGRMAGKLYFTIKQVIGWETAPFVDSAKWLVRSGSNLVTGAVRGILSEETYVGSGIRTVIRWVMTPFKSAGKWLVSAGTWVIDGLRDGMIAAVTGAEEWAATIVGTVVKAVKKHFGIKSPSTVFKSIGHNLMTSLFGAMLTHNPVQVIGKLFGGMPQALGALVNKGLVHITALPGKALSALEGLGGKFASLFSGPGAGIQIGGTTPAEAWIIAHESGGRTNAQNPTSTAFGLGQLLLANRINYGRKLGVDPNTTSASAQLAMMRMYIRDRYGNAENAEQFWKSNHWYDQGGIASGTGFFAKNTLKPERVLSASQTVAFDRLTRVLDRSSGSAGPSGTDIDYARLGDHVTKAFIRAGISVKMDSRTVGLIIGQNANVLGRTT